MDLLMRSILWPALSIVALLSSVGCKPEIDGNTYYCGPDAFCPPHLSCQFGSSETFSYSCVLPPETSSFSCPIPSADQEPDDTPALARDLGEVPCGAQVQFENWGCIEDGDDVDTFRFVRPTSCNGANPRAKVSLRVPLGASPLKLELVDESDQVVAVGVICTASPDFGGTEQLCIDQQNLAPGTYHIRISLDESGNADCGGQCRFNRYQIVVASPVS